jgi:hypothetical protein
MSWLRGLSTMLSAKANRKSNKTKAMATPKRPLRAGRAGLEMGIGVTQAMRRLAV